MQVLKLIVILSMFGSKAEIKKMESKIQLEITTSKKVEKIMKLRQNGIV